MTTNGELEIKLDDIEYLKKIHNAQALRELTNQPGWEVYCDIIQSTIGRLETQHLNFGGQATRDAYWLSGARLAGAREFAKIMQDQIAQNTDILNHPLRPPSPPDPADLDGDQNLKEDN
jgi:hypothetical protein